MRRLALLTAVALTALVALPAASLALAATVRPLPIGTWRYLGADGTLAWERFVLPPGGSTPVEVPRGGMLAPWSVVGLLDDGRAIAFRRRELVMRNPDDLGLGSTRLPSLGEYAYVRVVNGRALLDPFALGTTTFDFGPASPTGVRVQAEDDAGGFQDFTGPRAVDAWVADDGFGGRALVGRWRPAGVAGDGTIAGFAIDDVSVVPAVRRAAVFTARAGGAPPRVEREVSWAARDIALASLGVARGGFMAYSESLSNSAVPGEPPGYFAYVSTPDGRTLLRCSANQAVADDGTYVSFPCGDSLDGRTVRSLEVRDGRDGAITQRATFATPVRFPRALVGGWAAYTADVPAAGGTVPAQMLLIGGRTRRLHDLLGAASPGPDVVMLERNVRGQMLLQRAGARYLAVLANRVTGNVVGASGAPVPGAEVTVTGPGSATAAPVRAAAPERRVVRTDARGRFAVLVTGDEVTVSVRGACLVAGGGCRESVRLELGLEDPPPLAARSRQPVAPLIGGPLALAARSGRATLRLRCLRTTRCVGTASVRRGRTVLARGTVALAARRAGGVPLRLTKAGKALRRGARVAVTVRIAVAGSTVAVPATLRRVR